MGEYKAYVLHGMLVVVRNAERNSNKETLAIITCIYKCKAIRHVLNKLLHRICVNKTLAHLKKNRRKKPLEYFISKEFRLHGYINGFKMICATREMNETENDRLKWLYLYTQKIRRVRLSCMGSAKGVLNGFNWNRFLEYTKRNERACNAAPTETPTKIKVKLFTWLCSRICLYRARSVIHNNSMVIHWAREQLNIHISIYLHVSPGCGKFIFVAPKSLCLDVCAQSVRWLSLFSSCTTPHYYIFSSLLIFSYYYLFIYFSFLLFDLLVMNYDVEQK